MKPVNTDPIQTRDPQIRALTRDIADAPDPHIKRIVAKVDAMASRGPADALIEPLRQRLRMLRPPRPLRFGRLLFYPLDTLVVPAARWRRGRNAIPRTALMPIAEHVRTTMGDEARPIEAGIQGRTTADIDLIERLGRTLWPAAARILASDTIPATWSRTELGDAVYLPLAAKIAALLAQIVPLGALCAKTAHGLLPPDMEKIGTMLGQVAATTPGALPMLLAVVLTRLPGAAGSIVPDYGGPKAAMIETALDQATDQVLRQLDEEEGVEVRIAAGTMTDAAVAAGGIATLLQQLDAMPRKSQQREQLRTLRQRLDASCRARFTIGLPEEFLTPLQNLGNPPATADVRDLETAARGLRVLETEARAVGGGASYDFLLRKAAEAVKDTAMRDRLTEVDQLRLMELLLGVDAALDMQNRPA